MVFKNRREISFVVPRYHTNMEGWVQYLIVNKFRVSVYVELVSFSENYKYVSPKFIPNLVTNFSIASTLDLLKISYRCFSSSVIVRNPNFGFRGFIFFLLLFTYQKPILYTQTSSYTNNYRRYCLSSLLRIFRGQWVSPTLSDKLSTYGADYGIKFLPFLVPSYYFNYTSKKLDSSRYKILSIGKFLQRKNHIELMQNLSRYSYKYKLDIDLTIVGENNSIEQNDYHKECISCAIASKHLYLNIFLHENVQPNQIPTFYHATDLFVMYSNAEPASFSQTPALALGIPVLINIDNGTSHYILNNSNGFLLQDHSYNSFETALNSLLTNNLPIDRIKQSYLSLEVKVQQTFINLL